MRSDTRESRFPFIAIRIASTLSTFRLLHPTFSTRVSPEIQRLTIFVSLARVLPLPHVQERMHERGDAMSPILIFIASGSKCTECCVSQGIRTAGLHALWPVAGAQLTGRYCMITALSDVRANLRPAFAGRKRRFPCWNRRLDTERISAISRWMKRLMRLIEGSH